MSRAKGRPEEEVLFSLGDEDEGLQDSGAHPETRHGAEADEADRLSHDHQPSQSTKFTLGLKSSQSSKEAQFDADSDDLEDEDIYLNGGDISNPVESAAHGSDARVPLVDRIPDRIRASIDGLRAARQVVPGWDGEGLPEWLLRGAGTFHATVNMANSILGAGVVGESGTESPALPRSLTPYSAAGLPYSMRESGFVGGVFLLVVLSFLTDWTIRLIVLNAKLSGRSTYIDIMEHCFGNQGKIAVSIFQFAFAFGGMCAFCVVVGDTLPHVVVSLIPALEGTFLANRQFVIIVSILGVSYPLSLYRNIEKLSKASAVALFSMVLIIATVAIRGPAMPAELRGDPGLRFTFVNPSKIIRSIAVISFAFVCHHNSLCKCSPQKRGQKRFSWLTPAPATVIFGSLKEPSINKFGKVTHYSTLIAGVAATSISIAGYWSFTDKTLGNILNNFPADDAMVNLARFCFGLNMLITLPLECFVCREVLETYFFHGEYDQSRHLIFTSALVVSSLFVSLITCDLGIVLELTGGLAASALAYIFPAICYLKLSDDARKHGQNHGYSMVPEDAFEGLATDGGDDGPDASATEAANGSRGEISMDDVEIPLRPGAPFRHRPRESPSGARRKWWQSVKPIAVLTALLGIVVLVVSVATAIIDSWHGRGGAKHTC